MNGAVSGMEPSIAQGALRVIARNRLRTKVLSPELIGVKDMANELQPFNDVLLRDLGPIHAWSILAPYWTVLTEHGPLIVASGHSECRGPTTTRGARRPARWGALGGDGQGGRCAVTML